MLTVLPSIPAFLAQQKHLGSLAVLGLSVGMVVGFALPLATHSQLRVPVTTPHTIIADPTISTIEVPTPDQSRDEEIQRLRSRNRRLEVLLETLRQREQVTALNR